MNTQEFFLKVLQLTGDERPTVSWEVTEDGRLSLRFTCIANGKPHKSLSCNNIKTHISWHTQTGSILYQVAINSLLSQIETDKGMG